MFSKLNLKLKINNSKIDCKLKIANWKLLLLFLFVLFGLSVISPAPAQAAMILHSAGSSSNINQGLVGWWTFDGGDCVATYCMNKSTTGSGGTLINGAKPGIGKTGQGVSLDGVDDYISFDSSASSYTGQLVGTLSLWFKNPTKTNGVLFHLGVGAEASGYKITLATTHAWTGDFSDESIAWFIVEGATTRLGAYVRDGADAYNDGKWHNIILVMGTNYNRVYMDGVQKTLGYGGGGSFGNPSTGNVFFKTGGASDIMTIGRRVLSGVSSIPLNGTVDDLRIYNRPLSANEVYSLYKYGSSKIVQNETPKDKLMQNLVGWWTMDGADCGATYCADKSGNGNTGTVANAKHAMGKIGQGLKFNASGEMLTGGTSAIPATNGSISFWEYHTWANNDGIAHYLFFTNTGTNYFQILKNAADSKLYVGWYPGSDSRIVVDPGTNLRPGWNHWVVTWDDTNNKEYLYINNVIVGSKTDSISTWNSAGVTKYIGNESDGSHPLNGTMDDFRIYSRTLSANEVYSLYQYGSSKVVQNESPVNKLTNNLVGYWTFDGPDCGPTYCVDKSSTGVNGTLTNVFKIAGKIGQALRFTGAASKVSITNNANQSPGSAFTYSAWFNDKSTGTYAGRGIVSKYTASNYWILGSIPDTGTPFGCLVMGGGRAMSAYKTGTALQKYQDGKWHHGACVISGTTVSLYVDGQYVSSGSNALYSAVSSTNPVCVGAAVSTTCADYYWVGNIDDVRIYNTALSADEIYSLYMYGK